MKINVQKTKEPVCRRLQSWLYRKKLKFLENQIAKREDKFTYLGSTIGKWWKK